MSEVMAGPTEHLVARSDYETLRDERDRMRVAFQAFLNVIDDSHNEDLPPDIFEARDKAYKVLASLTPSRGGQEHD